jgi:hypothetical protein
VTGLDRLRGGPTPVPCDCTCHGNPAIAHVAPCCRPCSHCGARFQAGLEAHERTCSGTAAPA